MKEKGQSKYTMIGAIIVIAIIAVGAGIYMSGGGGGGNKPKKEPIKIALLNPMTGPVPVMGHYYRNADKFAIHDINNAKGPWAKLNNGKEGVLGRKIEFVTADSQCDPSAAIEKIRRLKQQEGIDIATGTVSSGVAKGAFPTLRELNFLLVGHGDSTKNLLYTLYKAKSKKNGVPLYFIGDTDLQMDGATVGQIVANKFPNATAVIGLGPNYTYGINAWKNAKYRLKELNSAGKIDVELKDPIYHDLGARNFSSVITRLQNIASNEKLVVACSSYADDVKAFMNQANTAGLFKDLYGFIGQSLSKSELEGLEKIPNNVYALAECWNVLYPETPEMKNWISRYTKRYVEKPTGSTMYEYNSVTQIALAIKKAESTEPHKVAKAMEGLRYSMPWADMYIRPIDHAVLPTSISYGELSYNEDYGHVYFTYDSMKSLDPHKFARTAEEIKNLRENHDVPSGPYGD